MSQQKMAKRKKNDASSLAKYLLILELVETNKDIWDVILASDQNIWLLQQTTYWLSEKIIIICGPIDMRPVPRVIASELTVSHFVGLFEGSLKVVQ